MENETNFDLHDHFGSIEELEQAMQKVHDAAEALTDAMIDSNLPPCISIGIAEGAISAFNHFVDEKMRIETVMESLTKLFDKIKED